MLPIFNDASTNFLGVRILGGDPVLGRFATNCARRLPKSELKIVDRTQTGWRHYSGVCSAHWSPFPNGKFFAVRILGGDSVGSITACQISEEYPKSFGRTHFGW